MKPIIFNRRNELLRVPVNKAVFYEAYGNYCYGVFVNKQKIVLPITLKDVELLLHKQGEECCFLRIGKRFLVNTDYIVQVNITGQQLVLSDLDHPGNFSLPVSKEALKAIQAKYEGGEIWK